MLSLVFSCFISVLISLKAWVKVHLQKILVNEHPCGHLPNGLVLKLSINILWPSINVYSLFRTDILCMENDTVGGIGNQN
jgi:hypothetical protein